MQTAFRQKSNLLVVITPPNNHRLPKFLDQWNSEDALEAKLKSSPPFHCSCKDVASLGCLNSWTINSSDGTRIREVEECWAILEFWRLKIDLGQASRGGTEELLSLRSSPDGGRQAARENCSWTKLGTGTAFPPSISRGPQYTPPAQNSTESGANRTITTPFRNIAYIPGPHRTPNITVKIRAR